MIPLVIAIGGAVDIAGLNRATSAAQTAADAAALAAAKALETASAVEASQNAQIYGRAQLSPDLAYVTLTDVVDVSAGTVTVTSRGAFQPAFLSLLHIDKLPFERQSKVAVRQKGYVEFQFLLDVSESMNIAASEDDRRKLQLTTGTATGQPCAFACHEGSPSVYQLNLQAGSNKARLRIDVLQEASDAMVDKLLDKNAKPESLLDIRVQTNGFSQQFEKGFGPSPDAAGLKASIRAFRIANSHTSYTAALSGLAVVLGDQGTGRSGDSPRKVALMITDGVKNDWWNLGPINPSQCDQIKSKGFDLAILEIKYVEDYDYQNYYRDRVAWYYPKISPSLQACASPGLYYLASDSLDAQAKLLALAEKLAVHKLRIAR